MLGYSIKYPLLVSGFALLIFLSGQALANKVPSITMTSSIVHPNAQQRTNVMVNVTSAQQLNSLRCYFKADDQDDWLFTIGEFSQINQYNCLIPKISRQVSKIVYRVLAITHSNRVIRTTEKDISLTHPLTIPDSSDHTTIDVYDEIGTSNAHYIEDENVKFRSIFNNSERYGLVAGFYEENSVPKWLGVKAGYFGGYEYSESHRVVFPVKGLATDLQPVDTQIVYSLPEGGVVAFSSHYLNIAGNSWFGMFGTTSYNNQISINSTISQSGNGVTIDNSKTGIAQHLVGTINSSGHMLLYDQYDGEDWDDSSRCSRQFIYRAL